MVTSVTAFTAFTTSKQPAFAILPALLAATSPFALPFGFCLGVSAALNYFYRLFLRDRFVEK